jgi:curli biogenesis system outer membrane secretion channel CsgG
MSRSQRDAATRILGGTDQALRASRVPQANVAIRWGRHGAKLALVVLFFAGCSARESHRGVEVASVQSRGVPYAGPKHRLVIGEFTNRSPYMSGIFSDDTDRLGAQARNILMTHLAQSGRFVLMDRGNMENLATEAQYSGQAQAITGGQIVLTGAVTEFGRREVGRRDAIFHRSRTQVAYAKVTISIVDVRTSQVVYSCQGAGEFDLTDRGVLGFGSSAGYDATLADKVLNLAMIEAVDRLIEGLERGEWTTVAE